MGADTQKSSTAWAFNAHVEALLAEGEFAINLEMGYRALIQYWHEIALVAAGVPFSEIGFSARREACLPKILIPDTAAQSAGKPVSWKTNDWGDYPNAPEGSIAVLKLRGVMQSESRMSSPGIDALIEDLQAAYAADNISGILLDINSPGGSSTAAAMLGAVIEDRNKPVIAHITGFAASGAYWAAAPTDEIIAASNAVEVGSIGAYMVIDQKALQEYRDRFMAIYSDLSPDKNAEFRKAVAGDLSGIKNLVNETAKDFHEIVTTHRALTGDRLSIKETLSGGMFKARDARTRGLIDGIGSQTYALDRMAVWMKKKKKM